MGTQVRAGLDRLVDGHGLRLKGTRCGLLCHPASVASGLQHAVDVARGAGLELCCLFGPEHGLFGEAQDMVGVGSGHERRTGIPIHSLYGQSMESLKPCAEWLDGLDLVIVDVQDVGSRYYTFVWTMLLTIQACAAAGRRVLVLDRPNPLGGTAVEGPSIEEGFTSFVGLHPLPVRHGLTPGEIALLAVAELDLAAGVELEVVKLEGWRREMYFDETGLPWVLPSPNMPTLDTALVYPGCCLLEGTNLSEGRGTTRPFELVGAPWVDGWSLASLLQSYDLPGVVFRPTHFSPTFHKHAGQSCGGVQLHVTDRRTFRPFRTGVALLLAAHRLWPAQFGWRDQPYEFVTNRPAIDLLAGGVWLRQGVERDAPLAELVRDWPAAEQAFLRRRERVLLY